MIGTRESDETEPTLRAKLCGVKSEIVAIPEAPDCGIHNG